MANFSYSQALQIAERLYPEVASRFHHADTDGVMFIGPADSALLQDFFSRHDGDLPEFSSPDNRKLLEEFPTSDYNVYFDYVDDNSWARLLYAYDPASDDLQLICSWGGED